MRISAFLLAFAPAAAHAFCGFYVGGADTKLYNAATQVVLMREGTHTVLSMQNNYQGPPDRFAMVVPVPVVLQKENVKTLPREIFDKIDKLDSPRLVEYWEQDPCAQRDEKEKKRAPAAAKGRADATAAADLGVKVEAKFSVGEYEIVILSAKDSTGLETWLKQEKYAIPEGAEPYLRPYVQAGSKFFVAKVDTTKVMFGNGMATLSPLRFHYDANEFSLPVRLGLINSKETQDLIVHVLSHGQRFEVANYPNVTIPTNLDVDDKTRGEFSTFYASLFDKTLEKNPKSVVTEYAWDAASCDPCPGPVLDGRDLATFGADVLGTIGKQDFMPWGFTLTRLHARYTKDALGADLVFKAAPPIEGGREGSGQGVNSGYGNNFQARYAIRHAWTKPITCKNPVRGIWGGPPPGKASEADPKPAINLAFAPRNADLKTYVSAQDLLTLGYITALPEADAGVPTSSTTPQEKKSGCGCNTGEGAPSIPIGLGLLALLRWRRKR
jgi:MYXO-CTERM domain-containing protein